MDLGFGRQHGAETLQYRRGHGGPCRDDPAKGREFYAAFLAVPPHAVNQRRGAEHVGDAEILNGFYDFSRVHMGGPGGVHVGNHNGHAQGRTEKGEEGKGGQVDFTGFNVIGVSNGFHLGGKIAVGIHRASGRAGAAAGKEDGRCFIRLSSRHMAWGDGSSQYSDPIKGDSPPKQTFPHGNPGSNGFSAPPQRHAGHVGLRDADKGFGFRLCQAAFEASDADPRIDEHRNGAHFKKRKG